MQDEKKINNIFRYTTLIICILILVMIVNILIKLNTEFDKINESNTLKDCERYYLYTDYFSSLNNEDKDRIKQCLSSTTINVDEVFNEKFFNANGNSLENISLKNDKDTISIKDIEGPICIEIIADWCQFCQTEVKEELDNLIETHPDCTFIQYMDTGVNQQVEDFYSIISKEPNRNLIIVYNQTELNSILENYDYSYPSMIYINSEHRIAGFTSGLLNDDKFNTAYNIANNVKTYELKTIYNDYLYELKSKSEYANNYISQLKYIDIPASYKEREN